MKGNNDMETPERIWAWHEVDDDGHHKFWISNPERRTGEEAEYIRADCIAELEAENARLRESLAKIAKYQYGLQSISEDFGHDQNAYNYHAMVYWSKLATRHADTARAALNGKKSNGD